LSSAAKGGAMRTNSNPFRTLVAGLILSGLTILPAIVAAQDRDDRRYPVRHAPQRGWQQRDRSRDRDRDKDRFRDRDDRTRWERDHPTIIWRERTYRYPVVEYRRINPNWSGYYYYRDGTYYYDPDYYYRASVDNEWLGIAGLAGGAALLGALTNDRTLFFAGAAGELYSLYRLDQDRNSAHQLEPVVSRARSN
jgi:hypothetical protein